MRRLPSTLTATLVKGSQAVGQRQHAESQTYLVMSYTSKAPAAPL